MRKNEKEVPESLVRFLKFLSAGETESMGDFGDDYVRRLQRSIRRIKSDREMGERYMLFEEMLKDERAEGREEGRAEGKAEGLVEGQTNGLSEAVLELLSVYGEVPADLREYICSLKDTAALRQLLKKAAQAKSISEFESLTDL